MLQALVGATPPTVAIWTTLASYYAFFAILAGVLVTAYIIYNIVKNREREGRQAPKHSHEGDWGNVRGVFITLAITGSVLGFVEYQTFASINLVVPPDTSNALVINVTGQQFQWTFQYPNGAKIAANLTIPTGRTIILNITSIDVVHSFTIPDLTVAKDATPGRYNELWFTATNTGSYIIRCKELCGVGHAFMLGTVTVVDPAAYDKWYTTTAGAK